MPSFLKGGTGGNESSRC